MWSVMDKSLSKDDTCKIGTMGMESQFLGALPNQHTKVMGDKNHNLLFLLCASTLAHSVFGRFALMALTRSTMGVD